MTTKQNRIAIGMNAKCEHDYGTAIGDDTEVTKPHEIVIGEQLFGEPIPEPVRYGLMREPYAIRWLLLSIGRCLEQATTPFVDSLQRMAETANCLCAHDKLPGTLGHLPSCPQHPKNFPESCG